ncbi:MAG: hypothetical protein ACQKBY_06410 [Verrucomicrobiales bacterium]
MDDHYEQRDWIDNTTAVAPALLGAATGMLLADVLDRDVRRPVGISLAALGMAALMPVVVAGIVKKVNGPHSRRGSMRRLRGIRDGGAPVRDIRYLEDDYSGELGVG